MTARRSRTIPRERLVRLAADFRFSGGQPACPRTDGELTVVIERVKGAATTTHRVTICAGLPPPREVRGLVWVLREVDGGAVVAWATTDWLGQVLLRDLRPVEYSLTLEIEPAREGRTAENRNAGGPAPRAAGEPEERLNRPQPGGTATLDGLQTAIHLAGRAVAAWHLGLACPDLALNHDKAEQTGEYGHAISLNPRFDYEYDSEEELQENMRDVCTVCCAGLAAEHVFYGVPLSRDNESAQGDFRSIARLESAPSNMRIPGKFTGEVGDEQTSSFIDRKLVEAKVLVVTHKRRIEGLAKLLFEKKKLSKEEVKRHLGEPEWVKKP
jgi:hypothetical protein